MAGSSANLARTCTDEAFMAETACCLQHWVIIHEYVTSNLEKTRHVLEVQVTSSLEKTRRGKHNRQCSKIRSSESTAPCMATRSHPNVRRPSRPARHSVRT